MLTSTHSPLPLNAYNAALDSFVKLGFDKRGIIKNYSFSDQTGKPFKVDPMVFADPVRRSPDLYASFTTYNAVNGEDDAALVKILACSSAPFHLIHWEGHFSFWISTVENEKIRPIQIQSAISYDQLNGFLGKYAVDLKPQRIIDVKQGRERFILFEKEWNPLQLSFFVRNATEKLLGDYFSQAVDILREGKISQDDIPGIAIQLLGAMILADTGVLGQKLLQESNTTLDGLIGKASKKFERYFDAKLFQKDVSSAEEAYKRLRQIRFSGFTPDMLISLYTKAYSEKQRKEFGLYDTPLYLTRRIWENIPVEYLRPEKRTFADMTCGWGSFLIAGHERLSRLSDSPDSLRNYLHGNDITPFVNQLPGLGLLLSTCEDSWHIDGADALEWPWLKANQPGIIVGNPPFGGDRKKSSSMSDKKRMEKANLFLKYALERLAPGGYLAMIMPKSFSTAEASPEIRNQLLKECDLLELWELPNGVFQEPTVRVVVLFAQKKLDSSLISRNPVRVRNVQANTLSRFEDSGVFTASGIVADQTGWNAEKRKSKGSKNTYLMDYSLILPKSSWEAIKSCCVALESYVTIISGAIQEKYAKPSTSSQKINFLPRAKGILLPNFQIAYDQAILKHYPDNFKRPRLDNEALLAGTKVLLVSNTDPSWGKRTKVAIERRGYYASHYFWVIVPKSEVITHEVIASILDWYVGNAWIIEFLKSTTWILKRAISEIPFPTNLSAKDCEALTKAIQEIEKAAGNGETRPPKATETIDRILKAAYQLDDETFERLRLIAQWDKQDQATGKITLDLQPDLSKADWKISGVVDSVNAAEGKITLWMDGFEELQTVPIDSAMPGWMLRPGAGFETSCPRLCIRQDSFAEVVWGNFSPQEYMYLVEDELIDKFLEVTLS